MSKILIISLLCATLLIGCKSGETNAEDTSLHTEKIINKPFSIPYKIAHGYFQKNNVKQLPTASITTQEEFDKFFGAAAVMGPDGQPTPIDFSKEFVIAVSKPETNLSTTFIPRTLEVDEEGNLIFNYDMTQGDDLSYTIVPILLIVVPNEYKANVILNEKNY